MTGRTKVPRASGGLLDVTAYVLTDRSIIEALREAAGRGVKVRIWRDASMAKKVGDFDVAMQMADKCKALSCDQTRPVLNSCI